MRWLRLLLWYGLFAAVVLGYYWLNHLIQIPYGYTVQADFDTLPPDDRALKSWLLVQPGIVAHTVHFGRVGPDRKIVRIMFTQVRNQAGDPPFPDFDKACRELGYTGGSSRFRHCVEGECEIIGDSASETER